MKTPEDIKPNFGPVYAAAMYPELAGIFQAHGYALAVHGSLARDFDLIAVPWAEAVADRETVLKAVEAHYAVNILRDFQQKNHGRVACTLCVGFGQCAIDLSFLSAQQKEGGLVFDEHSLEEARTGRLKLPRTPQQNATL